MSVFIDFKKVIKKYDDNTVIPGLSTTIEKGEFFTLLGPSGCGKTTLLRMVAGFNSIEGGEILFNEKCMNAIIPQRRNIGMVFQNYAIFPHLNVEQNVAFGLKNKKVSKEEIKRRVQKILDVVQIRRFEKSMPENLSGGQQQRIALARAIVMEPDVLLMDEPLSNLDAKLRVDMREAIKEIQNKIGITTIYVTHDQDEAMAISDRIAVMNDGEIQQVGTPREIYQRPSNLFVASFIGKTNILEGNILEESGKHFLELEDHQRVELPNIVKGTSKGIKVKVSIRPEEFVITNNKEGMTGTIKSSVFLGANVHYLIELNNKKEIEVIQESTLERPFESSMEVKVKIQKDKINLFDFERETNLLKGDFYAD